MTAGRTSQVKPGRSNGVLTVTIIEKPTSEINGKASGYNTSALRPRHLADLRKSGLTDTQISACGFRSLQAPDTIKKALGWKTYDGELGDCLSIPFFAADGKPLPYVRTRQSFALGPHGTACSGQRRHGRAHSTSLSTRINRRIRETHGRPARSPGASQATCRRWHQSIGSRVVGSGRRLSRNANARGGTRAEARRTSLCPNSTHRRRARQPSMTPTFAASTPTRLASRADAHGAGASPNRQRRPRHASRTLTTPVASTTHGPHCCRE